MNKKRKVGENWFTLPFAERSRLMAEHGRTGMTFGGKVTQLITASTGFDDWEWGVTLWARNPQFLKDIVYTMRFDEASARYAEFGPVLRQLRLDPGRNAQALPHHAKIDYLPSPPPSADFFSGVFLSSSGIRTTVTFVPFGGMFSVKASNSKSSLSEVLSTGRSSIASGKFETQIKSPASAM